MRSYVTNKMRRVPTYYSDLEEIVKINSGHIIASTACLGGYLGTTLLKWKEKNYEASILEEIIGWLEYIQDIFGKDNFYLEMQPSDNEEQLFVNSNIIKLSKKLNIPYIITNDAHYLKKEDAAIHKAFLNSQDGDREVDSFYATTYLMGTEELETYMNLSKEELNYAYSNILKIKNQCQDYSLLKPLKIPYLKWRESNKILNTSFWFEKIPYLKTFIESEYECDVRLAELVIQKLSEDSRLQNQETYDELNSNLKTTWISSEVNKARWSAYFLNLQNIIDVCWDAGTLVGPGRGSGVGFLLLYILDIIQINTLWEKTRCFEWRLTKGQGLLCLVTSLK